MNEMISFKRFVSTGMPVICLLATFATPVETLAQDIGKLAAASVWLVEGDKAGSGAFISADGEIVTAEHVVRGYQGDIEVRRFHGDKQISVYRAKVTAVNAEHDIALLKADLEGETIHFLSLADEEPEPPSAAAYCGFSGNVPRFEKIAIDERSLLHFKSHNAQLEHGDSGAPLVDASTRIIGVAIGVGKKTGHSHFTRLKHIRALLASTSKAPTANPVPPKPDQTKDEAIRLALQLLNQQLSQIRNTPPASTNSQEK